MPDCNMRRSGIHLPTSLLLLISFALPVQSQPALAPFTDCSSPNVPTSPSNISISQAYAQITRHSNNQRYLNITLYGSSLGEIIGESSNETQSRLLATMFTTTSLLTFTLSTAASAFCDTLRPPSPLPPLGNASNYCPLSPGQLAFSTASPLNSDYELTSLNTRIRVVDTSSPPLELACVDVSVAPLKSGLLHSIYGHAVIAFWGTVGLAISYWLVIGSARISSAWRRNTGSAPAKPWSQVQRMGFIFASAMSGERLATSPALLRYCTPSLRDVIAQTQWTAALGMVAVQWPNFAYPYFTQTAWATLIYNVTLTQGQDAVSGHWDPLHDTSYHVPISFQDQASDPTSPLFLDQNITNVFFTLPPTSKPGIESFAYTAGIYPQDAFGISARLFLSLLAGTIVISALIWILDSTASCFSDKSRTRRAVNRSRRVDWVNRKDTPNNSDPSIHNVEDDVMTNHSNSRFFSPFVSQFRWRKHRRGQTSFHRDALIGNLIRILLLFHLPITIFSCYQFTRPHSETSTSSIALAVLTFVVFAVSIPALLILRVSLAKPNKLYDDTRTLLSFGPLYNQYATGSQTFAKLLFVNNLILGIVIGCGQKSGTTQAIIILVTEVASALWTSVHLPWGRGAAMGVISFLFCVCRIITAVLLVILSPTVSVGEQAGGWIACAVLIIQGLIYAVFLLMLIVKIFEALSRFLFHIPFDRSRHAVDSGMLGVLSLSGLFGPRHRSSTNRQRYKLAHSAGGTGSTPALELPDHRPSRAGIDYFANSSQGPASVLHADQVRTPYREDMDDENGHILEAWQPITESTAFASASPATRAPGASKFTIVRGGRANFDTPYSIMPADTSSGMIGERQLVPNDLGSGIDTTKSLPAGAMPAGAFSSHVRTRSQTAIVGDMRANRASTGSEIVDGAISGIIPHVVAQAPDSQAEVANEEDEHDMQVRRKPWFRKRFANEADNERGAWSFLKGRRRSEGDDPSGPDELDSNAQRTGTSFVVIRDRPTLPGSPGFESRATDHSSQLPSAWKELRPLTPDRPPRSSRRVSLTSVALT